MWALPFGRRLMTAFASFCLVMAACGDGVNANDAWKDAAELNGSDGSVTDCNTNATSEAGEPVDTKNRSLWWKWTAPDNVTKAAFYTYGSDFDTVLGVYTGTAADALTKIAFNDDHVRWGGVLAGGAEYASLVSFDVTPGTAYYICVAGKDESACGNIKLGWCSGKGFSLVSCNGTLLGFIGDCPKSLTIPDAITKIEQSAFDRDCDAGVTNLNEVVIPQSVTEIGMYAFCKCVNLSSITFKGNISDINVDTYWGFYDTPFRVGVNANDAWGNAIELSGIEGTVDGWNGFATAEAGEPEFTRNRPLWWKWTAPDDMDTVTFHTQGSDFDTVLGVYTGTSVNALTKIAESNDSSGRTSSVSFRAVKGRTYYICVAGNGNREYGSIRLSWKRQEGHATEQTVTLDLGGGTGSESITVDYGTKVGDIPVPTRANYKFVGWFTAPVGGTKVSDDTEITSDLKLYARWEATSPGEGDLEVFYYLYEDAVGTVPTAAASTYDGYLYKDNEFVGTIQVKVGKPNKKTHLSSVKATVAGLDGKKKKLKAAEKGKAPIAMDGPTRISFTGGDACEVTLGLYGMVGKYGNYDIDGARNLFMSRDAADKSVAAAVLNAWKGAVNAAWEGAHGWNGISVAIANKGKAKVSVTLADGTKASANGQLIVGERWCCVPALVIKKAQLPFLLWLPRDGQDAGSLGVVGIDGAVVGKPGSLKAGAEFHIDAAAFDAMWGRHAMPYLPDGVAVESGTRWALPKAGKVAYVRGTTDVDPAKLLDNPSALKLTYRAKDGTFKGTFKVYEEVNGKPKATTVNVTGVLVDGMGYGSATIRKVGGLPVTVE